MTQKTILAIAILLLGCFSSACAQASISTSGQEYINNDAQINFTIGETVSGSYLGPVHLTEGFHQFLDFEVSVLVAKRGVDFSVYPNPTVGLLYLETEAFLNTTVQIIDTRGRVIQQHRLYSSKSQIDIKNLSSGIYILNMKNPKFTFQSIQITKTK